MKFLFQSIAEGSCLLNLDAPVTDFLATREPIRRDGSASAATPAPTAAVAGATIDRY